MTLSIIIPVFNVEPYVEKCIRSCEAQDIPQSDYEIVVINDGSTDNSLEVGGIINTILICSIHDAEYYKTIA